MTTKKKLFVSLTILPYIFILCWYLFFPIQPEGELFAFFVILGLVAIVLALTILLLPWFSGRFSEKFCKSILLSAPIVALVFMLGYFPLIIKTLIMEL